MSPTLGYPLFVKPARGGSSIGISKAHDASELDRAVEDALEHDPKVLVEVSAEGAREVECGVLQALDGTPETSVPAEVRVNGDHEFYDFAAKYLPEERTELDVPAVLPDGVEAQMRDLAARAFEAVGCEGLARVDFFVMPGRLAGRQRDQHHAGLHAHLDVPAHVGGDGGRLPGPGRPADPAGARPGAPACAEARRAHGAEGSTRSPTRQSQRLTSRSVSLTGPASSAMTAAAPSGRYDAGSRTSTIGR